MKVKLTKTNNEWNELSATEQQQASVIGDTPFMPWRIINKKLK